MFSGHPLSPGPIFTEVSTVTFFVDTVMFQKISILHPRKAFGILPPSGVEDPHSPSLGQGIDIS